MATPPCYRRPDLPAIPKRGTGRARAADVPASVAPFRDRIRPPGRGGGKTARLFAVFRNPKFQFCLRKAMTKPEIQNPDPRTRRADLQDAQAAHRPAQPDLVDHLLRRAAAAICPTTAIPKDEADQ